MKIVSITMSVLILFAMAASLKALPPDETLPNIRCESMRAIGWSYTFLPSTFTAGDTVTIKYRLVNDSSVSAGPFQVGLRVGGTIVDRNAVAELVNGGEDSGEFIWTAVCGVPVEVVADCDSAVAESNEDDNVMTDPGLECSQPNLALRNTSFSGTDPSRVKAGLYYRFAARVYGETATSRNVRVTGGVVGGAVLLDRTLAVMNPGDNETVDFTWEVPEGSSRIYIHVDPDNTITESNEGDNRWELAVTGVAISTSEERYDLSLKLNKMPGLRPVGAKLLVPAGRALTISGKFRGATGAIRDVTIVGVVKVKGNPPQKVYSTTIHHIESLVVPFSFSWTPTQLGETTISVQVSPGPYATSRGVRDSNPANNTDSIKVTVTKPKPLLRKM